MAPDTPSRRRIDELSRSSVLMAPLEVEKLDDWRLGAWAWCCPDCLRLQQGSGPLASCCQNTPLADGPLYPLGELLAAADLARGAHLVRGLPVALLAAPPLSDAFLVALGRHAPLNRHLAEAYMRLGGLPPQSLWDLRGELSRLDAAERGRARWVLSGCRAAARHCGRLGRQAETLLRAQVANLGPP